MVGEERIQFLRAAALHSIRIVQYVHTVHKGVGIVAGRSVWPKSCLTGSDT
jgi:hypothetical protein